MDPQAQYINAGQFLDMMKAERLVLVPEEMLSRLLANDKQADLRDMQKRYMRRSALTYKEIIEARLLPLKSKQGIEKWIRAKIIKDTEVLRPTGKPRKILTSAIRRLGYAE